MSIRIKMLILFALVGLTVFGGIVVIIFITQNQISQMEKQECTLGAERVQRFLGAELVSTVNASTALTLWDEYFAATQTKDQAWIEENVASCIKPDSAIEFAVTLDLNGKVLAQISTPAVIKELAANAFPVHQFITSRDFCVADLVKTRDGVYLLALVKIVQNTDSHFRNPQGYTLYGRKINRTFLEKCAAITGVKLCLADTNGPAIQAAGFKTTEGLNRSSGSPVLTHERNGVRITCWEDITDRKGQRIGEIAVQIFSNKGTTAVRSFQKGAWVVGLIIGLMIAICVYMLKRLVISPIQNASMMMKDIAEGDGNLDVKLDLDTNDEIGEMAKYFNAFVAKTRRSMKEVYESLLLLKNTSVSLAGISHTMVGSSQETSTKTFATTSRAESISNGFSQMNQDLTSAGEFIAQVAAAVEAMSQNTTQLAGIAEKTVAEVKASTEQVEQITQNIEKTAYSAQDVSNSVNSVVQSVHEINRSLNQVNQSCSQSTQITRNAKRCALETQETIEHLNKSSREISKIVQVINDIADQTNMLALNAAIEAASAGNAGKGFAVVAHEVKELASQTGDATEQISSQIETMKVQMKKAVKAMEDITTVIDEINTITDTITQAVYEQSTTINQISGSAVSSGAKVGQITNEIREIAQKAKAVAQSSEESAQSVSGIDRSVNDLSAVSAQLAAGSVNAKLKIRDIAQRGEVLSAEAREISRAMEQINQSSTEVSVCAGDTDQATKKLVGITEKLENLVAQFKI